MLKVSKLTDYGTVLMVELSRAGESRMSATELAERTGLPATTVAKLLKQLTRAGLTSSTRGTTGGYQLAKPAADISVAALITALEGPIAMTECSTDENDCSIHSGCSVASHWRSINEQISTVLQNTSLADMATYETVAEVKFQL